ncbi:MAG TPA: DUF885 domain-containing protein [Gammaproteobacteria bacterium]|nr:DUF885 domain-containing protein [Gammaproteobacteria bacterium]
MKHLTILLVSLLLATCSDPAKENTALSPELSATDTVELTNETTRINDWFYEKNEERLMFSPISLSALGRKELYDQIDEMSVEAEGERLKWMAATVVELKSQFNYEALDFEAKTSYDLWVYQYEQARDVFEFTMQEYVFEQMSGVHSQFPVILMNYHSVDSISDMEAYISRIAGVSRALEQQLEWAKNNAERGVRPPRFAYEFVMDASTGLISGQPFDDGENNSALWDDAQTKIEALVETGEIGEAAGEDLKARARDALMSEFQPAYQALIDWLSQDISNSPAEPRGVATLPNGTAFYDQMLRNWTTTDLTADEIHKIGLDEVARLRGEMEEIKDSVGYPGDIEEFFAFIASDERFFYSDDEEGRQQYLDKSTDYIESMKALLPKYFGILPKADLVVKRVEAFREQDGAAAHYFPSSPDGSVPGTYYIHLSDMTANPTTELEAVAYHEGLPGHHMQIAIARELEALPAFRSQANFGAYSEGWALYTEALAKEMGGYQDPYSDFGRLVSEMWRAVRLVVDTGIHAMGWSEQQAIDYFASNVSTPLPSIVSEVRRYTVLPGQATSYKIGMLKIQELRARAEKTLGDTFDIRDFHDVVLGGGALPLRILERRVDNYILLSKEQRI